MVSDLLRNERISKATAQNICIWHLYCCELHKTFVLLRTMHTKCWREGTFLLFMFHVCLCWVFLSVTCSLVFACRERADAFALCCVFVTFPYGVLGQCGTWLYRLLISLYYTYSFQKDKFWCVRLYQMFYCSTQMLRVGPKSLLFVPRIRKWRAFMNSEIHYSMS